MKVGDLLHQYSSSLFITNCLQNGNSWSVVPVAVLYYPYGHKMPGAEGATNEVNKWAFLSSMKQAQCSRHLIGSPNEVTELCCFGYL